jgi:hypothetical protein
MTQTKQLRKSLAQPGILAALGAALLFGSGAPNGMHPSSS